MKIIVLTVFLLVVPTIAFGDSSFNGKVTDSSDAPISAAMVLIHWDSAGSTVGLTTNVGIKEDLVIRTQGDGTFKVVLPPGFYDVFVAARAFSPTCRKIRVKQGDDLEVTLRMSPDPIYTAEMGDRIEAIPLKN